MMEPMEGLKIALWQTGIILYWFWLKCLAIFFIHRYWVEHRRRRRDATPVNLYGFIVRRNGGR